MRARVITLLCTLLGGLQSVRADVVPSWENEPLTLARCVELALQDVVTDAMWRARIAAAEAMQRQAHTVPNPVASYMAQDIGLETPAGPALLHQAMLSLPPFYAYTRQQEARVAAAEVRRVHASVDEDRRQLILQIGRAYHDARLSGRLAALEVQAEQLATDLVQKARQRVAHGDAGQQEVIRAQAEALDARRTSEAAQRRYDLDRLTLSILLGAQRPFLVSLHLKPVEDSGPQFVMTQDEAKRFDSLLAQARSTRPDLRAAQAQLQRSLAQLHLEQRRILPLADLQLAGGLRQQAAGVGGVITISMPLPIFDHNRSARAAAQAAVDSARASLLALERRVGLELAAALRDFRGAREALLERARPAVELRARTLAAAQRQFTEGVVPLLEAIIAQRDLVAAERNLAQAERDAALAAWRLRWIVESQ